MTSSATTNRYSRTQQQTEGRTGSSNSSSPTAPQMIPVSYFGQNSHETDETTGYRDTTTATESKYDRYQQPESDRNTGQSIKDRNVESGVTNSIEQWNRAPPLSYASRPVATSPPTPTRSALLQTSLPPQQQIPYRQPVATPRDAQFSLQRPQPSMVDDAVYGLPVHGDYDRSYSDRQESSSRVAISDEFDASRPVPTLHGGDYDDGRYRGTGGSGLGRRRAQDDVELPQYENHYYDNYDDDDDKERKSKRRRCGATHSRCVGWTKTCAIATIVALILAAMFFGAMIAFSSSPSPPHPPSGDERQMQRQRSATPPISSSSTDEFESDDLHSPDEDPPSAMTYVVADQKTMMFEFRVTIPTCESDVPLQGDDRGCVSEMKLPPLGGVSAASIRASSLTCTEVISEVSPTDGVPPFVYAHARDVPQATDVSELVRWSKSPTLPTTTTTTTVAAIDDESRFHRCAVLAYDVLADPDTGFAYVVLMTLRAPKDNDDGVRLPTPQCALVLEATVAIE